MEPLAHTSRTICNRGVHWTRAIMFYRISHLEKQMDNTDKHISEMREEIRNEIRDLRLEIGKMNQNFIDHLKQHNP